jgi:hypothetical protein
MIMTVFAEFKTALEFHLVALLFIAGAAATSVAETPMTFYVQASFATNALPKDTIPTYGILDSVCTDLAKVSPSIVVEREAIATHIALLRRWPYISSLGESSSNEVEYLSTCLNQSTLNPTNAVSTPSRYPWLNAAKLGIRLADSAPQGCCIINSAITGWRSGEFGPMPRYTLYIADVTVSLTVDGRELCSRTFSDPLPPQTGGKELNRTVPSGFSEWFLKELRAQFGSKTIIK